MSYTFMIKCAAISGFLAVALGAFGAHGLKNTLSVEMMSVFQTSVQYQSIHTLALLAVAILYIQFPGANLLAWSGLAFLLGLVIFSGSLYILSLSGMSWLGAITPIGGLCFLLGWCLLLISAFNLGND